MTFLEAKRLLNNLKGGRPVAVRFGLSGTPDPLLLYMKPAAAAREVALEIQTLPFGTLRQHLMAAPDPTGTLVPAAAGCGPRCDR